eukprot:scaffold8123_cov95-Isochrysis_galbana.AAC.3
MRGAHASSEQRPVPAAAGRPGRRQPRAHGREGWVSAILFFNLLLGCKRTRAQPSATATRLYSGQWRARLILSFAALTSARTGTGRRPAAAKLRVVALRCRYRCVRNAA